MLGMTLSLYLSLLTSFTSYLIWQSRVTPGTQLLVEKLALPPLGTSNHDRNIQHTRLDLQLKYFLQIAPWYQAEYFDQFDRTPIFPTPPPHPLL